MNDQKRAFSKPSRSGPALAATAAAANTGAEKEARLRMERDRSVTADAMNGPELPAWLPIGAALVIAFLLSTEFLFQPFVWRHFEMAEIVGAWATILRDRVIVGVPIAVALVVCWRVRMTGRVHAIAWQVAAVTIGAAVGEWLTDRVSADAAARDTASILGEVVRWTLIGLAVTIMLYLWRGALAADAAAQQAGADAARLRRLIASGRIEALQRQIEPHFLFNTLATIRSLHHVDPARGQGLLGHLLTLVSRTLGARQERPTTLGGEVALVRAYLGVCQARLSGALTVICDVPDALLDREVPPLALSTLAENAIKHGIGPRDGGVVTISAALRDGGLAVDLFDDGVGFADSVGGGGGIGLANIGERLRLLYGPAARLELVARAEGGVRAGFWIPDRSAA